MVTPFLKLYLIYMFKVMPEREKRKGISDTTYGEIDLAQNWRQKTTAREVLSGEESHQYGHQQTENEAMNDGRRHNLHPARALQYRQRKVH